MQIIKNLFCCKLVPYSLILGLDFPSRLFFSLSEKTALAVIDQTIPKVVWWLMFFFHADIAVFRIKGNKTMLQYLPWRCFKCMYPVCDVCFGLKRLSYTQRYTVFTKSCLTATVYEVWIVLVFTEHLNILEEFLNTTISESSLSLCPGYHSFYVCFLLTT